MIGEKTMKMKVSMKIVFAMLIFLGVLVAPVGFISPVKAVAAVTLLSHTGYLDLFGWYHVVGEVQNTGDQTVNVNITATFYDSSDVVIFTWYNKSCMLDVLLVDRKSPFDIFLSDTTQSAKVDHYSLSVTFSATSPIPIGLEILSHSSYVAGTGWMHIVGEIKNIETEKATDVKVIATYYDGAGDVVAAAFRSIDYIDPGQDAPFEILLDYERTPYVVTYELTAESTQHAIVPEFPTWTSMLLILMVLTVAIAIYKRRLLKTPIH